LNTLKVNNFDGVLLVEMSHGVTNAIGTELLYELTDLINDAGEKDEVTSIVLSSSNEKFFSIGFNLPELLQLNKTDFGDYYQKFNRLCVDLFTLNKPTIAALTGHAIAGGFILALCCDYRFISEGRTKVGLNEIKLGLPIPYPANCILQALVGNRIGRDVTYGGNFYTPSESFELGLVDKVLPPKDVIQKAINCVGDLSKVPEKAFSAIKSNRVDPVMREIEENLAVRERDFSDFWFSEEARIKLEEAKERF